MSLRIGEGVLHPVLRWFYGATERLAADVIPVCWNRIAGGGLVDPTGTIFFYRCGRCGSVRITSRETFPVRQVSGHAASASRYNTSTSNNLRVVKRSGTRWSTRVPLRILSHCQPLNTFPHVSANLLCNPGHASVRSRRIP